MMSTMLALADVTFASEISDVSLRSSGSLGKSRTEKGQSFADSEPLARAKAEEKPDTEDQVDESSLAEAEHRSESADVSPVQEKVEVKRPVAESRHQRGKDVNEAPRGDQAENQAATVEETLTCAGEQVQARALKTAAEHAQVVTNLKEQGSVAQTCQVAASGIVEEAVRQLADSEIAQSGQLSPQYAAATPEIVTTAVVSSEVNASDASNTQVSASIIIRVSHGSPVPYITQAVAATGVQSGMVDENAGTAATTLQQKVSVESPSVISVTADAAVAQSATTEAQSLGPAIPQISEKVETLTEGQRPLTESQLSSSASTKTQMEVASGSGQGQGSSSQMPDQTSTAASQQTSVGSSVRAVSVDKADMSVVQNAHESTPDLPGIISDTSSTAEARISTQTVTTAGAETATLKSSTPDITEQLGSALRAGLDRLGKQLTIRLQPPELGSVVVRIEEQGQQIRAVLEVSRAETGRDIEQVLPQVVRNLQESGLQIRKFDVVVSDQFGKDAGSRSSSQDPWSQQQTWSGAEGRREAGSRSAWSSWNAQQQDQNDSAGVQDSHNGSPQGGIDWLV